MGLSRDNLLDLMALADGELEGEARARAERLMAESPEACRVVEAMRASVVQTWLGEGLAEERARGGDGIADAVMGRLGVAEAAPLGVVRRIAPASSRASRLGPRAAAGVLVAMAAAALVYVGSSARHRALAPVASVDIPTGEESHAPGEAANARRSALAAPPGVVVDEIDSPSRDVSIFQIPGIASASAASSSVVVWIDDDPGAR